MNLYVDIMNNVIDHIEQNISERLTLESVSKQFYLSEFHFSRLFRILTGTGIKKYILGRKLAVAAEKLKDPQNTVTDIAYGLGFEYPEVFSRNFKKWFGVTPAVFKNGYIEITTMPKAFVVDRDIVNYQGVPALNENYLYMDEQTLYGMFINVDENDSNFAYMLQSTGEALFSDKQFCNNFTDDYFYTVVNCYGDDNGRYSVFYGGKIANKYMDCSFEIRNVPACWYACFTYRGKLLDMLSTFNDDFYRWILVKEIELLPNGIGMLNIFERQNVENVRILVPVKEPK